MARRARGTVGKRPDRAGWWIRWRASDGRRRQAYGGTTRRAAERELAARLEAEDAREEPRLTTLAEFLDATYDEIIAARLAPKTYSTQVSALDAAADAFADVPMDAVDDARAERYIASLAAGRSPATLLRHRSTLSACWKAAQVHGLVRHNPWLGVKIARAQERPVPFLEQSDLDALYAKAPEQIRALVVILGETGLRRGEALGLRWGDVAGDLSALTVRKSKSGRVRTVPLRSRVRALLATLDRGDTETRVLAGLGETWTPWSRRLWRETAKACGHPTLRLHDLRHARAALLVRAQVPVPTVARWLGHATPALVLTRYGHRAPADEMWQALELSERSEAPRAPRRVADGSGGD